jgi:nucleoside-diphosphate-sugar epimerase
MKKVLLTGATGFIGRHCPPQLLTQGYEVHAIYSRIAGEAHPNVHWHKADLLVPMQITRLIDSIRPTHLLHLAWYAIPGKFWTSSENFRWVQASLTLLQEFARRDGQRVVMAGSCAEYDWKYGYCSEQVTPLFPSSIYGICKHSLQAMLEAYSVQFGLSSAWGRIFFLYGTHEHPSRLVSSVIRSLLQEEPAPCTHGEQIRDFLHVYDVADAFVALLESDVSGPVNIASGCPVAVKKIVLKIADQLNQRDLLQLGALPLSDSDPPLLVADVTRLSKEVNWQPKYDLDYGLEQTIGYWKQQLLNELK